MIYFASDLAPIIPEISLTLIALFCMILGLYGSMAKAIWWIAGILIIPFIIFLFGFGGENISGNVTLGSLVINLHTQFEKGILLFFALLLLLFYGGLGRIRYWTHGHHEYIVLLLLSTISGMIAISARDFLVLYASLELMSLVGYVFASYDRDSVLSSEAGMKYFILGSLVSCIMLFGMSYIYGFSGSLSFADIRAFIANNPSNPGLIAGLMIFLFGILFKLSLAPLHFWTQDVYQGSPLISVAYFSSIPKFVTLVSLLNIRGYVLPDLTAVFAPMWIGVALVSMFIGAFGAIAQTSLKRLIGYSAILNSGFVLLGMSALETHGLSESLIYQIIYSVSAIGLLAVLAITIVPEADDYPVQNLSGFGAVKKLAAFSISVFIFSLAGIPPLAGFFGKALVIWCALTAEYFVSSTISVLLSVVAAFYYINIVRLIYFSAPTIPQIRLHESSCLVIVISFATAFVILFPLFW
ncbi:MAG: NADH-quinone oxidoreductase subunit N [Rickettsiaceae bacterium]|nr:NADH-quinone oxidoreductase subunit N [Rickettsiaceae bacterium]